MTGETTLKEVIVRLGKAMDALEHGAASRLEHEIDYTDGSEARAERLEEANREVSRRLVTAMETIRAVLDR
jgi:hypothetical protein